MAGGSHLSLGGLSAHLGVGLPLLLAVPSVVGRKSGVRGSLFVVSIIFHLFVSALILTFEAFSMP